MLTQSGTYIILVTIIYFHIINVAHVASSNTEEQQQDQKRLSASSFGQWNTDPNYFLINHPYYDNDIDTDMTFHKKRQTKKKWSKFIQGSQSPYTIAFPALIRTRRRINQEQ